RLNISPSSMAAAQILRENYTMLGTWPLAITAYNHGANGMKQAVNTVGTTDFGVIVQRYRGPLFGFASQNFYAEFLAAIDLVKNYKHYFGDILFEEPSRPLTLEARMANEPELRVASTPSFDSVPRPVTPGATDGLARSAVSAQGEATVKLGRSADAVAGERSEWRPVPLPPDTALGVTASAQSAGLGATDGPARSAASAQGRQALPSMA